MWIRWAKMGAVFFGWVAGVFLLSPLASANVKEVKAYEQAFPAARVKCLNCHTAEKPSKTGPYQLNHYGQVVLKAEKNPTPEMFKKLGKAEDFKKN